MVSILAFYSDDQSLDFTEADSKINLKITKINRLKTSDRILQVKWQVLPNQSALFQSSVVMLL